MAYHLRVRDISEASSGPEFDIIWFDEGRGMWRYSVEIFSSEEEAITVAKTFLELQSDLTNWDYFEFDESVNEDVLSEYTIWDSKTEMDA